MRFATRTFLFSFIPFALLLTGSFWAIQRMVESKVRDELRTSLRETHESIAKLRARSELQNSRFLRILGESPALKAGMQLLSAESGSRSAQLTVEDQLRENCSNLGFDLLIVSDAAEKPVAGVLRVGGQLAAMDPFKLNPPRSEFLTLEGFVYQVATVPVDQGEENLGKLTVGELFDFSQFNTPAVLTRHGRVLRSSIPGVPLPEVQASLLRCPANGECEVRLRGETLLSLPMQSVAFGDGYVLRTLQSVDAASGPVQMILRNVFLLAGLGALLAASILSFWSSRSIVRPMAEVVAHLRESEATGVLPEFRTRVERVHEIRELAESFSRAAEAIGEARERLHQAYVEFVGSLASALDARDRYTAGHSRRVSEFSCSIARAMKLPAKDLEEIRIGALLHDIGKIGIPDGVLQKPDKLSNEEYALIQQHPGIGRRILEGVHGFHTYLPVVELHHENWDGSGYPWGLRGEATPLHARIVHVADVYDAMTTDRPYRRGLSHEQAISFLHENAGTYFDPDIVPVFSNLAEVARIRRSTADALDTLQSMQNLAEALGASVENTPDPTSEARRES